MTTGKGILIVYPHNPFRSRTGIDARYLQLLSYLKARDFNISLLSFTNFDGAQEVERDFDTNILDRLFLFDFKAAYQEERRKKWLKPTAWLQHLGLKKKRTRHPDYAFPPFKGYVEKILENQDFDYILISYIQWAGTVEIVKSKKCSLVLDLTDFTTLKLMDKGGNPEDRESLLTEEIRRVGLFDKVMCISEEEMQFFSRSAPAPHYYHIPHFLPSRNSPLPKNQEYDLLFIGSDNSFNRQGVKWFLQTVFPLLAVPITILVVGKITAHLPQTQGVTCIPFAPHLEDIYSKAKISICPMLGGTGIKIKTIEALSYGLPVVSTSHGMTGHPEKSNTGCVIADIPKEFAEAITRLLQDQTFYSSLQHQGHLYFMRHFQEAEIYRRLDTIFR